MKIRTISVEVYRSPYGDCSNDGISSRFSKLAVACPSGPDCFDTDNGIPDNFCMVDRRRHLNVYDFSEIAYSVIVPATVDGFGNVVKRPGWWMYGGNIADTSDSRFRDMAGGCPLRIHDRRE